MSDTDQNVDIPLVNCKRCTRLALAGETYCCSRCNYGGHTQQCNLDGEKRAKFFADGLGLNLIKTRTKVNKIAPLLDKYRTKK